LRRGHPGTTKRGRGRPSAWSPELGKAICALIADGLSLRAICERPGMPDRRTVFRWLGSREEFRHQYSIAREFQADLLFDEILEIADNASGDIVRTVTAEGREVERIDHENIQRSKLRVDTRKWMAGKLVPKKYGERIAHEHGDPRGNPIGPTVNYFGCPESLVASKALGGNKGGDRDPERRRRRG
jgi:terminase small subunit-like protein